MDYCGVNRSQTSLRLLALERIAAIDAKAPAGELGKMRAALDNRSPTPGSPELPMTSQELEVLLALASGVIAGDKTLADDTKAALTALFAKYLTSSLTLGLVQHILVLRVAPNPWIEVARRLTAALLVLKAPASVFETFLVRAKELWSARQLLADDEIIVLASALQGFMQGFPASNTQISVETGHAVFTHIQSVAADPEFQPEMHRRLATIEQDVGADTAVNTPTSAEAAELNGSANGAANGIANGAANGTANGTANDGAAPPETVRTLNGTSTNLDDANLSLQRRSILRCIDDPQWYPGPAQLSLAVARFFAVYASGLTAPEDLSDLAAVSAHKIREIESGHQFRENVNPHLVPVSCATMYSHFDVLDAALKAGAIDRDEVFVLAANCLRLDQYDAGGDNDEVLSVARVAAQCALDSSEVRMQLLPLLPGFFGALGAHTAFRAGKVLAKGLEKASESTRVTVLYTLVNELTADECIVRSAAALGGELAFLKFVASVLSALVAFVNEYDDIQICGLAVSILAQKYGTVNTGVDVQILSTWALLAPKLTEGDFDGILDQICRAERAAWKADNQRLIKAVEEARVSLAHGLEHGSLFHRLYLKHILDMIVLQGESRHVTSDASDNRKFAQRSVRELISPLAAALPGVHETPADFGDDWSLMAKFRDVWFNLAVLGLRGDDPGLSREELQSFRVIARSTPPLVSELSANHVESDLELNPVLRRDMPTAVFKQQRDWLARFATLKPTYGSVKTMFLVSTGLLETLRARAGIVATLPRYFEDPDFRHGAGFGSMQAIALQCIRVFIGLVNDRMIPLDNVAAQLKELLVLGCHRQEEVRSIALKMADLVVSAIPAAICHRTSMFALLDLLTLMNLSCVGAEEDEYEPKSRFRAAKSGVVVHVSDEYVSRRATLNSLLSHAGKWSQILLANMEADAKSLLAAYLNDPVTAGDDDFDNNAGRAHRSALGRSFALEIATAASGDFIAQYMTQFRPSHSVNFKELKRRFIELEKGDTPSLNEIRTVYSQGLPFFEQGSGTAEQLWLAKRSVGLAFRTFTGASMATGTIFWQLIVNKVPRLQLVILEEVFHEITRTVQGQKGLFSRKLDGEDPMFAEMHYAPSDKRTVDREILLLNRQFAPHVRLIEYVRSHMRASADDAGAGIQLFADMIGVLLDGVDRYASLHPIARNARLEIVTMGFELLTTLIRTSHRGAPSLRSKIIAAGLSWYRQDSPRWPYGSNLIDQRRVISLLGGQLTHLSSLQRPSPAARLLFQLTAQEQSRMRVWIDPLDVKKHEGQAPVARVIPFDGSDVRDAWEIDPVLAVHVLHCCIDRTAEPTFIELLAKNPLRVSQSPAALQYFVGIMSKSPYKHVLLYWAQTSPIESINLLSSRYGTDSYLLQYTLRSLEMFPITKCFFYVPQIVQQLRHDTGGYVAEYILEAGKFSQKFSHQIIWNINANSYLDDEATRPDPMKPSLDEVLAEMKRDFTEAEEAYYKTEFGFFEEVTDISGKLKPYIKKSKQEKKAKIDEEMAKIKLPEGAYLPSHPDGVVIDIDRESGKPLQSHAKAPFLARFKIRTEQIDIGEDLQTERRHEIDAWQGAIFKVGDDCRQDLLALQIISVFQSIFAYSGIDVFVFPYKVTPTAAGCGVIDVLPNSVSRDMLGREAVNGLKEWFLSKYGGEESLQYHRARNNFVKSMAAYSVISYLLQFKDRHNGNIMYDGDGHIIHIDFGFCFDIVPGGVKFEAAPFKLTKEMIAVMGGKQDTPSFRMFEDLCVKAYLASRVFAEDICRMVVPMLESGLPCFKGDTIGKLRHRFALGKSEREAAQFMRSLIKSSYNSNFTKGYDEFQRITNGIPY